MWTWKAPERWQLFLKYHHLMTDVFHRCKLSSKTQFGSTWNLNKAQLPMFSKRQHNLSERPGCPLLLPVKPSLLPHLSKEHKKQFRPTLVSVCVYTCIHVHIWGLDISVGWFHPFLSTLFVWDRVFTKSRTCWFKQTSWPRRPSNPVSATSGLRLQAQAVYGQLFMWI